MPPPLSTPDPGLPDAHLHRHGLDFLGFEVADHIFYSGIQTKRTGCLQRGCRINSNTRCQTRFTRNGFFMTRLDIAVVSGMHERS